jgi:hypothetical protein
MCFDVAYDKQSCAKTCRERTRESGDMRRTADACIECVTKEACINAGEACSDTCDPVAPMPGAAAAATSLL